MKKNNKMRTLMVLFLTLTLALTMFAGCGKKTQVPDTLAGKVYQKFIEEIKKSDDLETVANAVLSDENLTPFAPAVFACEPGFLNGFNDEITNFKSGVCFGPMIGSIPFIGYIFESDDPSALKEDLTASHQLNWNICTTADEMLCEVEGNYVFFVMAPTEME